MVVVPVSVVVIAVVLIAVVVAVTMAVVMAMAVVGVGVKGKYCCQLAHVGGKDRPGCLNSLPRRLTINPKELTMKRSSRRFVSEPSSSRSTPSNMISTLISLFPVSIEPSAYSPKYLHKEHSVCEPGQGLDLPKAVWEPLARTPLGHYRGK
jgi:hypothetical protein